MKIHYFATIGDIAGVVAALESDVWVDAVSSYSNMTPLMCAVKSSSAGTDMVELLIDKGADVNAVGGDSYDNGPVLFHAVKGLNFDKVKMLVDAGTDPQKCKSSGYDMITSAIYAHSLSNDDNLIDIVQLFINKGVSVNGSSPKRESPLIVASRNGRFEVVRLLLDYGVDDSCLGWTDLMKAVVFGTFEDVRAALVNGCDLTVCDCWARTAWLLSVQIGDIAKSKLLLDAGSSRNEKGSCNKTPLMYAVSNERLDMLRWLLDEGFDIEDTDKFSNTALIEACENGYADCVKILLEYGANIKATNDLGKGLSEFNDDIIEMMKDDIDDADELQECVDILVNGQDDNVDVSGEKAISVADNFEIVRILVEAGADINDINDEMREVLTGTGIDKDLYVSKQEYLAGKEPRYGVSNPEVMDIAFWKDMIRSGVSAYRAKAVYGEEDNVTGPVWCFDRFGRSITEMPDGRIIEIAGEHEDHYDPEFCIYNDVVVHHGNGEMTIYGYPKDIFGPTDFHTATLIDGYIYIIGCLGYIDDRIEGFTPVYRLDCESFAMEKIETFGEMPGWISQHEAHLENGDKIIVTGGNICINENYDKNKKTFVLDLKDMKWTRA